MENDRSGPSGINRREVVAGVGLLGATTVVAPGAALAKAGGSSYDVVIVGGGSAGAVLANRLSSDPRRRVLLLEAGKAYDPESYPDPVRLQKTVGGDKAHDWGFVSEPGWSGRQMPVPRARVLGGCSAINAGVAMRPPASDFERWAREGLPHWSHGEVLPFYRRSERTAFGDDRFHGRDGPWPIHQLGDDEISDMQRAFVASAQAAGVARVRDFNGDSPFGAGPYPMNNRAGERLNTGMTFLSREVRARPNLTIRGETLVDRVDFAGGRAIGILLETGERVAGGEVVLSGGVYGSAAILMRSGIGPSAGLRDLGIPVVADLPVGTRLQDHPFYFATFAAHREKLGLPVPPVGAIVWTRSSMARSDEGDIQISAVHYGEAEDSPTGAIFKLAVAMTRPQSRGSVVLADRSPRSAPRIALNLLGEAQDRQRIVEGVELARRIAMQGPLARLIASELLPGPAARDQAAIERALPKGLDTYHHATSTAPMGGDRDPHAVVDYQGRVRGLQGLRVADASIFPDVPSATPGSTVVMLAERISDWIAA